MKLSFEHKWPMALNFTEFDKEHAKKLYDFKKYKKHFDMKDANSI